jgi:hypothetical protein
VSPFEVVISLLPVVHPPPLATSFALRFPRCYATSSDSDSNPRQRTMRVGVLAMPLCRQPQAVHSVTTLPNLLRMCPILA